MPQVIIPHPLRRGDSMEIPAAWAWQPDERRRYIVHYDAYRAGRWVYSASGDAWAFSAEEAATLVRQAGRRQRLTLQRLNAEELAPVVYSLDDGRYVPRERWRCGWPLAYL